MKVSDYGLPEVSIDHDAVNEDQGIARAGVSVEHRPRLEDCSLVRRLENIP